MAHLGSGFLRGETPVDGGCTRVALRLPGADVPLQGILNRVPSLEVGPSHYAELQLGYPFGKLRTGFSQLPCLGSLCGLVPSAILVVPVGTALTSGLAGAWGIPAVPALGWEGVGRYSVC